MAKWFTCNHCDNEIQLLKYQITQLRELVALKTKEVDVEKERVKKACHSEEVIKGWNERIDYELKRALIKCELYDKVMTGLRINVNLNEKKK